jgi:hypothetical protein
LVTQLLTFSRLSDTQALNQKVQEAVNVYDEYMKSKDGEDGKGDGDKSDA